MSYNKIKRSLVLVKMQGLEFQTLSAKKRNQSLKTNEGRKQMLSRAVILWQYQRCLMVHGSSFLALKQE